MVKEARMVIVVMIVMILTTIISSKVFIESQESIAYPDCMIATITELGAL